MDKNLEDYLLVNSIEYKEYPHVAVFTVAESTKIKETIPGLPTKNLFLKDQSNRFFLVCMFAHTRLNLKKLKTQLDANKKLTFASPEELKVHLNLTPGSVSIFGMIYAKDVSLIIDKKIWEAEQSGFHPNVNTSTIVLSKNSLKTFIDSLNIKPIILDLQDNGN